ncbi:MAG: adenylosuccinate lyase [SAR86 cluster bacterium]|uniref:Adenylosuccinate lyase n=1 Tax=SAR86 cluster bacterium TaxID=2030880 RepID=A0A368BP74_9GAMM|nr:MAG: adenylosuccinate lyase [SAR86 cluster bacterium]|tara:strand:+ start:7542 stop:8894 length:1353 start_codon:yes stop_codon:yes gene_type:complete
MDDSQLRNLSPLDGRYHDKTKVTREIFSELGLIKARVKVEALWLSYFLNNFRPKLLNEEISSLLTNLASNIPDELALRVKEIEQTTNHDVKAVEIAIAEQLSGQSSIQSLVHIFLTSEDVNSASHALMLKDGNEALIALLESLLIDIKDLAANTADIAMLARTHGQPASPTSLGKELNVFATRIEKELQTLKNQKMYAKWGGATANYNPHVLAYPDEDWVKHSQDFMAGMELELTTVSTQIEPHDYMAEVFQNVVRVNNVLLDFAQDVWSYIAFDYFKLKVVKDEVGSSTMPHKVNPIDFENAEGNLGLSSALLNHLANKLTQSRLQRDLSDSTALRNIGSAYGYLEIALSSLKKGVAKLEPNNIKIKADLEDRYEILAEALQSFLRLEGNSDAYNAIKDLSRGASMNKEVYEKAVNELVADAKHKEILLKLKPETYVGLASILAKEGKK